MRSVLRLRQIVIGDFDHAHIVLGVVGARIAIIENVDRSSAPLGMGLVLVEVRRFTKVDDEPVLLRPPQLQPAVLEDAAKVE